MYFWPVLIWPDLTCLDLTCPELTWHDLTHFDLTWIEMFWLDLSWLDQSSLFPWWPVLTWPDTLKGLQTPFIHVGPFLQIQALSQCPGSCVAVLVLWRGGNRVKLYSDQLKLSKVCFVCLFLNVFSTSFLKLKSAMKTNFAFILGLLGSGSDHPLKMKITSKMKMPS